MTFSNEIEKTKEDIAILQEKLKKLEELEILKSKSLVKEAFKKVFGYYPEGCEKSVWVAFQKGYNASKEDCKVEEEPTPSIINCTCEGTPPVGCSSWTEWFELFGSKGILYGLKISSLSNKVEEPKPKPGTLYWALKNLGNYDDDNCDVILNAVRQWLPGENFSDFGGAYERGWDKVIRTLKDKLK
jgi:hypothetical protein